MEPLYYWQQTEDDLTVTIRLAEDITKEDIQVEFLPDHINIVLKNLQVLGGKLYSSIDHESSTWIIKENNRYFFIVLYLKISFVAFYFLNLCSMYSNCVKCEYIISVCISYYFSYSRFILK